MSEVFIHPTACVDPAAQLGVGVFIGPFCVVGKGVILEDRVRLDSHVVCQGRMRLGSGTRVWPFASLGTEPQDLKYAGEDAELVVGRDNRIREYCNLSIGTKHGGGQTVVGDRNLLMVNCHIAHDCRVGSQTIFANGTSLAGHVEVGDMAVIGGHVAVHQYCRIGTLAMVAGGSIVVQDVAPFITVHGNRAAPTGLNVVGLRRAGFSASQIQDIKRAYRWVFRDAATLDVAMQRVADELGTSDALQRFRNFCLTSRRGLCR